jgi:hypothetical protein
MLSKNLVPSKEVFAWKIRKKNYVEGTVGWCELNEKFGDFSLLEDKNFGNWSKRRKLLKNYVIGQFENDSLADTD